MNIGDLYKYNAEIDESRAGPFRCQMNASSVLENSDEYLWVLFHPSNPNKIFIVGDEEDINKLKYKLREIFKDEE